ncbi:MAG: histidine--tRNA ligase [Candidatus Omnitrophica bacterium]|nr:histidine--tRNA ligase [Candidatus Omnitrophota bacterium]
MGGTSDIFPDEARHWQRLEAIGRRVLELYGYQEIRTPLIEEAAVFTSSLGEAAEIVTKQMYLFQDRGGRSVALRPEGTASVVRAFIEKGLDKSGGLVRFYYLGPMFRAERQQAGRRRQFHQLGVEVFGSASPFQDVEVVLVLTRLLREWKLERWVLRINSLGCREDRAKIVELVRAKLAPHREQLCEDCKLRLEKNPLRILDCKEPRCVELSRAVDVFEAVCSDCREHFNSVAAALEKVGVSFERDPHLVRGLDYYTRTAFEVIHGGLGAQNALGGGGRYDDLVQKMGGAAVPAVGFAVGLERIRMVQETAQPAPAPSGEGCYVAAVSSAQIPEAIALAEQLRERGTAAWSNLEDRPLRRQMEQASKLVPKGVVLILGEEEVRSGQVTVKEMATGKQRQVSREQLLRDGFYANP